MQAKWKKQEKIYYFLIQNSPQEDFSNAWQTSVCVYFFIYICIFAGIIPINVLNIEMMI